MNYYGGYGSGYGGYGGYDRYGGFDFNAGSMSGMENAALGFVFTFVAIFYLVMLAYVITNYVIRALGLHRIAKNSGVENAWLAWIPLADLYLLGKVTGDVSLGNRKLKNTALWLLLVPIIGGVISVLFYFGIIISVVVAGVSASRSGQRSSHHNADCDMYFDVFCFSRCRACGFAVLLSCLWYGILYALHKV